MTLRSHPILVNKNCRQALLRSWEARLTARSGIYRTDSVRGDCSQESSLAPAPRLAYAERNLSDPEFVWVLFPVIQLHRQRPRSRTRSVSIGPEIFSMCRSRNPSFLGSALASLRGAESIEDPIFPASVGRSKKSVDRDPLASYYLI